VDADKSKEKNAANSDDSHYEVENVAGDEEDVLDVEWLHHLARLEKVSIPPL